MAVKEKIIKDPVKEQEALLKALKVVGAMSAGADTLKNLPFAGKKGREKFKETKFNADSIFENAVEGTDVMENAGMEPGAMSTYVAGNAYDVLNPVNIALAGLTKVGGATSKLAKLFSLVDTAAEEGGKKLVKKNLPKYIENNLREVKDMPLAKRIAEEAIETGASKNLSNPKKALKILKGEKERIQEGGTKVLPIHGTKKTDGTLDKIGQELESTVVNESKSGAKVNKADIYRKQMGKVRDTNAEGIAYKQSESAKDKVLQDALSPFDKKTIEIVRPPNVPKKPKSMEAPAAKGSKSDELFGENVIELPPKVPERQSLEDAVERVKAAQAKPAKESADEAWEKNLQAQKPVVQNVEIMSDAESSLEDLWKKKIALRKEFKESTYGKPMHEWSDKDKTLESVIDQIDEEIVTRMSGSGQDAYKGLNQKYQAQSKLANIFEDQVQRESKSGGQAVRTGAEAATGGAGNPAALGRMAKGVYEATVGPKRMTQLGNALQNRKVTTPLSEFFSEMTEAPFDPAYLKDRSERTETAPTGEEKGWEEVGEPSAAVESEDSGRSPASEEGPEWVEVPESESTMETMSPDSGIGEEETLNGESSGTTAPGADPIHQKMDHALSPEQPQWDPYVNEEVLNTFLPRDSKRILANPTALMAKMQQVAPNQVPMIQEMLDNDPESLEEAGPKLAIMYPALFEKDKYGMFDGKIVDPQMQQKFLADLSQDEGMDAIQKANLAMKIQRGESIHS